MDEEIRNKDHSLVTFLLTAILSLIIPLFGGVALLLIAAAVGAGLASSHSPLRFIAPLPGCAGAWLAGSFFESSPPASLTLYVIAVLLGLVIARSAKKHDTASAQVLKVSALFAVIFGILGGALIYAEFGTLSEAAKAYGGYLTASFDTALESMMNADTSGSVASALSAVSTEALARNFVLVTPGVALAVCEVFGWAASLLSRPILSLYGRNDLRPMPPVILLPTSAAVIYIVAFLITRFPSDALYYVLENLLVVLTPAFACIGVTAFRVFTRRSPGAKTALLVILTIVLILIQPAILLYILSAAGVFFTVKRGVEAKLKK